MLEVAFPGTVCYNGNATGDEVVSVEIADKDDEIIKGITIYLDTKYSQEGALCVSQNTLLGSMCLKQ